MEDRVVVGMVGDRMGQRWYRASCGIVTMFTAVQLEFGSLDMMSMMI